MNYNFNGTITQNGQPISAGGVYLHRILLNGNYLIQIFSTSNTPFTKPTLVKWLYDNGYDNNVVSYPATISKNLFNKANATTLQIGTGVYASSESVLNYCGASIVIEAGTGFSTVNPYSGTLSALTSDTVIEM